MNDCINRPDCTRPTAKNSNHHLQCGSHPQRAAISTSAAWNLPDRKRPITVTENMYLAANDTSRLREVIRPHHLAFRRDREFRCRNLPFGRN